MSKQLKYAIIALTCLLIYPLFCRDATADSLEYCKSGSNTSFSITLSGAKTNTTSSDPKFYTNDNAKFFRDVAITLCTFVLGYYAVTFQITSVKDKHGQKYQRDDHLHLLAIKKRIQRMKHSGEVVPISDNRLPFWFYLPFLSFFSTTFISTILYECYLYRSNDTLIWLLIVVCFTSFVIAVWYIIKVLYMLYKKCWTRMIIKKICKETSKAFVALDKKKISYEQRTSVEMECLRNVTSAFYSLDFYDVAKLDFLKDFFYVLIKNNDSIERSFSNALMYAGKRYSVPFEPQISCLVQFVKAHCTSYSSNYESISSLLQEIKQLQGDTRNTVGCLIIGICVIIDLESMKNKKTGMESSQEGTTSQTDFIFQNYHLQKSIDSVYKWLLKNDDNNSFVLSAYQVFVEKTRSKEDLKYPNQEIKRYIYLRENDVLASRGTL